MSSRLSGRRAIVTGAASGIGAATVKRLIADGASVLAVDRVADGLAGTHILVADVTAHQDIVTTARRVLGGLDILVNNAGVCPVAPIDDLTDEMWNGAFEVNVAAAFRLSRACVPMLRESSSARIINTGSILSRYGDAQMVAYSASKHAILGLTRALAMELGPHGITVNCIQPGAIVTGMTRDLFEVPASVDYYRGRSALGRLGQPEDVADVFAFLASDDSRFITGQGILVDGGVMVHS